MIETAQQLAEAEDDESAGNDNQMPRSIRLDLLIEDPQAVAQLLPIPEGRPRQAHASTALRIGLLALEQARGQIDTDSVRREGERILSLGAMWKARRQRRRTRAASESRNWRQGL